MMARLGPVRYNNICNVNAPLIEPNQTLLNRTSPLDTTKPARYGTVVIKTAHQNLVFSGLTKRIMHLSIPRPTPPTPTYMRI